jgi:hypothetical protein
MPSIARTATLLAGLVTAGVATSYTVRSKDTDFSAASLAAADLDAAGKAVGVKPKL